MRRPLNLARRPFRNETLPSLLMALAAVGLLAATVVHAAAVRRLLPDRTSALHKEVAALETEASQLRADAAALRGPAPAESEIKRWRLLKELVDRRAFGWTALLARLEAALPPGIKLVSIEPSWKEGEIQLGLVVDARSPEEGFDLVRRLEQLKVFEQVYPLGVGEQEGASRFRYTMLYRPQRDPTPFASPAAAATEPAADADASEGDEP